MNSLIKETNDNLKAIIDTLKENLDSSINSLESIQVQMDKKVEEAKKFKIQVDEAKDKIKGLESDNRSLDLSLKELNDKYGKMNLVSVIEAGNREIKAKINDNIREINKQKEHIAELTSKARTIKDLLMNLKKDKSTKEDRLESLKVVYEYYSTRVNDVIDYAFNHSENLVNFKEVNYFDRSIEVEEEVDSKDLDNTMLFDEIASIDGNKNFKDEMSFISDQIDKNVDYKTLEDEDTEDSEENNAGTSFVSVDSELEEELSRQFDDDILDTTQMFNSIILDQDLKENNLPDLEEKNLLDMNVIENAEEENIPSEDLNFEENKEPMTIEEVVEKRYAELEEQSDISKELENLDENAEEEYLNQVDKNVLEDSIPILNEEETISVLPEGEELQDDLEKTTVLDDAYLDEQNEDRLSRISNLFSTLDNININENSSVLPDVNPFGEELSSQIDNAYEESFGQSINEEVGASSTVMDIFGNPIVEQNDGEVDKIKAIEDLFIENGLDFNKFKEDEKNYLKQIYDEEKFNNIFASLKRNKISLENIYDSFNIFGEITANELENVISKLLGIGQSVEAIGFILEKLPRVKKYNLDEAINSYGDYIKDIDITELIIKAKELYKNGGNN